MRLATVYQRRDKFIVCPNGKTTAGVWIGIEPIVVLHTSEHEPLGCAVRRALHASRSNLRHPELEEWDSIVHVSLVVAIEDNFGIRFKVGEVESTQNIADLIVVIQRHLVAKG